MPIGFCCHREVSFNQVPNVNITNINEIMEVKRLLSRSVTLGQAGRFHIKWTGWNLPGGPQCWAVKPEPPPAHGCWVESRAPESLLPAQRWETRCPGARGCRKHRGLQRHRECLMHLLADVTKEGHLVVQGGDPSPPWFWRPWSLMNPQAIIWVMWAFRECSSLFLPSALSAMWSPTYAASFVCLLLFLLPRSPNHVLLPLTPSTCIPAFLEFMAFRGEQDKKTNSCPTRHLVSAFWHFS